MTIAWSEKDQDGDKICLYSNPGRESDDERFTLEVRQEGKASLGWLSKTHAIELAKCIFAETGNIPPPPRLPPAHSSAEQVAKVRAWLEVELATAQGQMSCEQDGGLRLAANQRVDVMRRVLAVFDHAFPEEKP